MFKNTNCQHAGGSPVGDRKGTLLVTKSAPTIPRSLLLGTQPTQVGTGKIGWLNLNHSISHNGIILVLLYFVLH